MSFMKWMKNYINNAKENDFQKSLQFAYNDITLIKKYFNKAKRNIIIIILFISELY